MAITTSTSSITFNDSTTQSTGVPAPGTAGNILLSNGTVWTSATPTYIGQKAQLFTSSGTFTPTTGITAYKITLCGGGGGGYGSYNISQAGTGGTSTFSTISSTGGGGAGYSSGGSGYDGSYGTPSGYTFTFDPTVYSIYATTTIVYGAGGSPGGGGFSNRGGPSPIAIGWVTGITSAVTVTVGTGGGGNGGGNGSSGFVLVEW